MIIIHTIENCKFCEKAKELVNNLEQNCLINGDGIFQEIELHEKGDGFLEKLGKKFDKELTTYPQVIINGKLIGGYDSLLGFVNDGIATGKIEFK